MKMDDLIVKTKNSFQTYDYVAFSLFLIISAAIGIFFSIAGMRQKSTTNEYLTGGRDMSLIPVAVSILVTYNSAILILGSPAEIYLNGTFFFMSTFGMILACIITAFVFVPLFYPLGVVSIFEYLEMRFQSKCVRIIGDILYLIKGVFYVGIASYAPSTALQAMSGLPTWVTIILCGIVGTFYTCLGGFKAVIWTDVFQAVIMMVGVFAIIIKGTVDVGGLNAVWNVADEYDRIDFSGWSLDPRVRHTMWGLVLGTTFDWIGSFGIGQSSVQRFCSVSTLFKAKLCVLLNIPGALLLTWSACFSGMVVFSYYLSRGCDVFKANYTDGNTNEIIPYFVMDRMNYPSFPGIFIAALFSGALSSISSSLNACAAIVWQDILSNSIFKNVQDWKATLITKLTVVVFGILGVVVGFLFINLGGTVIQASISFFGALGGPITGLFFLAAFFPHCNWLGASTGPLIGIGASLWVSLGAYSLSKQDVSLSKTNLTMCDIQNQTLSFNSSNVVTVTSSTISNVNSLDFLYSISYLWYALIGVLVTIIAGLFVSLISSPWYNLKVDPKYVVPFCLCDCKSGNKVGDVELELDNTAQNAKAEQV